MPALRSRSMSLAVTPARATDARMAVSASLRALCRVGQVLDATATASIVVAIGPHQLLVDSEQHQPDLETGCERHEGHPITGVQAARPQLLHQCHEVGGGRGVPVSV